MNNHITNGAARAVALTVARAVALTLSLVLACAPAASTADFFLVYGAVPLESQTAFLQPWIAAIHHLKSGDRVIAFNRHGKQVDVFEKVMFVNPDREAAKHAPAVKAAMNPQDESGFDVVNTIEIIAHDHQVKGGGPYYLVLCGDPRYANASDPSYAMKPWSYPNLAMAVAPRENGPLSAAGRGSLGGTPVMCILPFKGADGWFEAMRSTVATWTSTLGGKLVLFNLDPTTVGQAYDHLPDPIPGAIPPKEQKPAMMNFGGIPIPDIPVPNQHDFFGQTSTPSFNSANVVRTEVAIRWSVDRADMDLHCTIGSSGEACHAWFSHLQAKNEDTQSTATLNKDILTAPADGQWERIIVDNPAPVAALKQLKFWSHYYSGDVPVEIIWKSISYDGAEQRLVHDGKVTLSATGASADIATDFP